MAVHAAFGGSTNLLLHIPAIAHAAGLPPPDGRRLDRRQSPHVPRLVDVLPNGPVDHPTVRVFLAGGVPEVMLHLRALGLLDAAVLTVTGEPLGEVLDWWETSERRRRFRDILLEQDGVDPDDVIMSPARGPRTRPDQHRHLPARQPRPGRLGHQEHRHRSQRASTPTASIARTARPASSPARRDAIAAIKSQGRHPGRRRPRADRPRPAGHRHGRDLPDHLRLKHLPFGKHVAVVTDARFSGVSTGACIGHVGPEALAGGPIGKLATAT